MTETEREANPYQAPQSGHDPSWQDALEDTFTGVVAAGFTLILAGIGFLIVLVLVRHLGDDWEGKDFQRLTEIFVVMQVLGLGAILLSLLVAWLLEGREP